MRVLRQIIEIDEELCNGCGLCVSACADGAIEVVNGKARLIKEQYCDGLGACIGECPTGALKISERLAEEFDAEAVDEHLRSFRDKTVAETTPLACGCPSAHIESFGTPNDSERLQQAQGTSYLSHWPVQIRLVPPTAPFLQNVHLLVVADCAPLAYPRLHQDFLRGRVVLVGCPKFDEVEDYIARFAAIFREAEIKDILALVMEVPCCQGLPIIIKKGMTLGGKTIPMSIVVISRRGEVLTKKDDRDIATVQGLI